MGTQPILQADGQSYRIVTTNMNDVNSGGTRRTLPGRPFEPQIVPEKSQQPFAIFQVSKSFSWVMEIPQPSISLVSPLQITRRSKRTNLCT